MTQISNADSVRVVLATPSIRLSTVAGLLSCAFAITAVFVFPIVFVPAAIACGMAGGIASLLRRNVGGLAASGLGVLIALVAALKSPAIWLTAGAIALGLFAAKQPAKPSPTAPTTPVVSAASTETPWLDITTKSLAKSDHEAAERLAASARWMEHARGIFADQQRGLNATEQRYRQITTDLGAMAERVQRLPDGDSDPAIREQVAGRVSQVGAAMTQLSNQVQDMRSAHQRSIAPALESLSAVEARCKTIEPERREVTAACQGLMSVSPDFRTDAGAMASTFERVETTYKAERARQAEIARSLGL